MSALGSIGERSGDAEQRFRRAVRRLSQPADREFLAGLDARQPCEAIGPTARLRRSFV